jgi:hypothetical protein
MMRRAVLLSALAVCLTATAQPPDPPLADARLSIHTLVREDVFAGILEGDMIRLARGEQSIELLLVQRPAEKPDLLVWKGGIALFRAVRALEEKRTTEFEEKYRQAMELLSEAKKLGPNNPGVAAATGGIYALLADRLPEKQRSAAWATAYDCYQQLWKLQGRNVQNLPLHLKGELLGGLAQSAQRTGRTSEVVEFLDKIMASAPDSPYAKAAKQWKDDPKTAVDTRVTCLSCHNAGRLAARRAALSDKSDTRDDPAKKQ